MSLQIDLFNHQHQLTSFTTVMNLSSRISLDFKIQDDCQDVIVSRAKVFLLLNLGQGKYLNFQYWMGTSLHKNGNLFENIIFLHLLLS